jgi:hypothetical protein
MKIGRFALVIAAAVAQTLNVAGEPKPKVPPRFEDYPATEVFARKPAPPKIVRSSQRRYQTRIREGVEKGWGVYRDGLNQAKPGPNFAGDMIFIQWSCGPPCLMAALVNARTGEVYNPPLAVDGTFGLPLLVVGNSVGQNAELEFRENSRLMIVSATPNWFKKHARSYRHYFVWESNQWRLIYKEPFD